MMMRRLILVGCGVTLGVIAVRKLTEVKSTLEPQRLNRTVGHLIDRASNFINVLCIEMRERETELRAAHKVEWVQTSTTSSATSGSTRKTAAKHHLRTSM